MNNKRFPSSHQPPREIEIDDATAPPEIEAIISTKPIPPTDAAIAVGNFLSNTSVWEFDEGDEIKFQPGTLTAEELSDRKKLRELLEQRRQALKDKLRSVHRGLVSEYVVRSGGASGPMSPRSMADMTLRSSRDKEPQEQTSRGGVVLEEGDERDTTSVLTQLTPKELRRKEKTERKAAKKEEKKKKKAAKKEKKAAKKEKKKAEKERKRSLKRKRREEEEEEEKSSGQEGESSSASPKKKRSKDS